MKKASIIIFVQLGFLPADGVGEEIAKEVADEVIFMDEGMIVERADTKEFFANPKSDRTKLFLSQIL